MESERMLTRRPWNTGERRGNRVGDRPITMKAGVLRSIATPIEVLRFSMLAVVGARSGSRRQSAERAIRERCPPRGGRDPGTEQPPFLRVVVQDASAILKQWRGQ